jgi:hypothetical protein
LAPAFFSLATFDYICTIKLKQLYMKRTRHYVNGREEQPGEMKAAKEILINAGIYRTLGNFGPYFPNKLDRLVKHIETFVKDGFEFTIIESEVMSFSFDSLSVSAPHKQKEAWFQPVK